MSSKDAEPDRRASSLEEENECDLPVAKGGKEIMMKDLSIQEAPCGRNGEGRPLQCELVSPSENRADPSTTVQESKLQVRKVGSPG
ncbi:hypothetical protein HOY82DRAFT_608277 [Tuber indicum]|nr:hypothetical protein HOY82DRAFT_608277 [Tuber indicum]